MSEQSSDGGEAMGGTGQPSAMRERPGGAASVDDGEAAFVANARVGELMFGARASMNKLDLAAVEEDLRIKARTLAAIEAVEPADLPDPGPFLTNFVRTYARYLEAHLPISADETVEKFRLEYEAKTGASSEIRPLCDPSGDAPSGGAASETARRPQAPDPDLTTNASQDARAEPEASGATGLERLREITIASAAAADRPSDEGSTTSPEDASKIGAQGETPTPAGSRAGADGAAGTPPAAEASSDEAPPPMGGRTLESVLRDAGETSAPIASAPAVTETAAPADASPGPSSATRGSVTPGALDSLLRTPPAAVTGPWIGPTSTLPDLGSPTATRRLDAPAGSGANAPGSNAAEPTAGASAADGARSPDAAAETRIDPLAALAAEMSSPPGQPIAAYKAASVTRKEDRPEAGEEADPGRQDGASSADTPAGDLNALGSKAGASKDDTPKPEGLKNAGPKNQGLKNDDAKKEDLKDDDPQAKDLAAWAQEAREGALAPTTAAPDGEGVAAPDVLAASAQETPFASEAPAASDPQADANTGDGGPPDQDAVEAVGKDQAQEPPSLAAGARRDPDLGAQDAPGTASAAETPSVDPSASSEREATSPPRTAPSFPAHRRSLPASLRSSLGPSLKTGSPAARRIAAPDLGPAVQGTSGPAAVDAGEGEAARPPAAPGSADQVAEAAAKVAAARAMAERARGQPRPPAPPKTFEPPIAEPPSEPSGPSRSAETAPRRLDPPPAPERAQGAALGAGSAAPASQPLVGRVSVSNELDGVGAGEGDLAGQALEKASAARPKAALAGARLQASKNLLRVRAAGAAGAPSSAVPAYAPPQRGMAGWLAPAAALAVAIALAGSAVYGVWAGVQSLQRIGLESSAEEYVLVDRIDVGVDRSLAEVSRPVAAAYEEDGVLARIFEPPVDRRSDGPISEIDPDTVGAYAGARTARGGADGPIGPAPEPAEDAAAASAHAEGDPVAPLGPAAPGAADGTPPATDAEEPLVPAAAPVGVSGRTPDDAAGLAGATSEISDVAPAEPAAVEPVALGPAFAIRALAPVWIRLRGPGGSLQFSGTLESGDLIDLEALDGPFELRTGNAGGTLVIVSGQAYGPLGDDGRTLTLPLTPSRVESGFPTYAGP